MAYNDNQAALDSFLVDCGGTADTNFRITAAGVFQIKNTTDSKYHTAWLEDDGAGSPVLKIAETGET